MLNAWINKNDILKLLDECYSIGGLIERKKFISNVNRIKEHRKPKTKNQKPVRINFTQDIKNDIRKYQFEVKAGKQSYIDKWINENFIEYYVGKEIQEREPIIDLESLIEIYDTDRLYLEMNIIPQKYLTLILNVSKRTLSRWENKGIINRYPAIFSFGFDFYDLSEILDKIKSLKTIY